MKDDELYLKHIRDSISKIEEYTKGIDREKFLENSLIQDGVVRQLEIIGEATKKLSQEFRSKYPQSPWKDIAGMRDKLIHGYFGVNLDAVWDTVKSDIPNLKDEIRNIR